jgi:hypothetical protein
VPPPAEFTLAERAALDETPVAGPGDEHRDVLERVEAS